LRPKIAPYGDYLIKSNQELREQVFRIFDQTFSVTYILQTIGIIICALGIFLSLTILVTERRREISILRAVGASRGQIEALVLWEAGIIGLLGSFLGIVAGLALAWVLSFVINVSFFGWTISWATPWRFLFGLPRPSSPPRSSPAMARAPGRPSRHRRRREDGIGRRTFWIGLR